MGSEGTLCGIFAVTVELRYLNENPCSISAVFTDVVRTAAGVMVVAAVGVQPSNTEMQNHGTMGMLDGHYAADHSAPEVRWESRGSVER